MVDNLNASLLSLIDANTIAIIHTCISAFYIETRSMSHQKMIDEIISRHYCAIFTKTERSIEGLLG